jgi:hypothetical protein
MCKGTVNGSVTTTAGSTIAPGESVGVLTVSTDLTLGGNLRFAVNKALSPAASNSVLVVGGMLTNADSGTLTVTNLNPAAPLVVGDRFVLFSQPVLNGGALTLAPAGAGLGWSNSLALDGSISVIKTVATNPTNLMFTVLGGNTLHLSWPSDHLGWHLQSQTNSASAGLGTNWITFPGTDLVTSTNVAINPANPTVFYRMIYP